MPGFDVWSKDEQRVLGGTSDDLSWPPEEMKPFNVVRMSQSFVEGWRKCPRSAVAEQRPTYGEAAALGIIAHSIVDGRIINQAVEPAIDATYRQMKLDELTKHGWVPPGGDFLERAGRVADVLTQVYLTKYHQFHPNVQTEVKGQIIFDVRSDPRTPVDFIIFTGSADLVCLRDGSWRCGVDWKTGYQMPEPWTIQRYGVQWRAYAVMFSLDEMHFEYPLALAPLDGTKPHWVADRYKGVATVRANFAEREAYRRQLEDECTPIASRLFASTMWQDHDPRPTDWHCSAKWCQVFAARECVGQDANVMWVDKSHREAPEHAGAIQTMRGQQ